MSSTDPRQELTRILQAIKDGGWSAHDELMRLVYAELQQVAANQARRLPASETLQPTALVNEVFLRLFGHGAPATFENRAHFFWAAARVMRDLLVEHARSRAAIKRGGAFNRIELCSDLARIDSTGS